MRHRRDGAARRTRQVRAGIDELKTRLGRHDRTAGIAIERSEGLLVETLRHEGWYAVRALVPSVETNRVMDELWEFGARGILVTDIHACRL